MPNCDHRERDTIPSPPPTEVDELAPDTLVRPPPFELIVNRNISEAHLELLPNHTEPRAR